MAAMAILIFASARVHYRQGTIRMDIWCRWISGLVVGSIARAYLVSAPSGWILEKYLLLFLMALVILMLISPYLPPQG